MGLTYIASVTASASATVSFTTGIDATYNEYQFRFVNMQPADTSQTGVAFGFQVNAVGQSGFNEVMTTTWFRAYHYENNAGAAVQYIGSYDQAQGTAYQPLSDLYSQYPNYQSGQDVDDMGASGVLTLYDPSSTTYVKHFVARVNTAAVAPSTMDVQAAGYINTTTAIDEISFKMTSGNITAGSIHMYGVG